MSHSVNDSLLQPILDSWTCNHPFAVTLVFYQLYQRSKLSSPPDLLKIAKKYRQKPTKLLSDLCAKYPTFACPTIATYSQLLRICALYNIPDAYLDLILDERFRTWLNNIRSAVYFEAESTHSASAVKPATVKASETIVLSTGNTETTASPVIKTPSAKSAATTAEVIAITGDTTNSEQFQGMTASDKDSVVAVSSARTKKEVEHTDMDCSEIGSGIDAGGVTDRLGNNRDIAELSSSWTEGRASQVKQSTHTVDAIAARASVNEDVPVRDDSVPQQQLKQEQQEQQQLQNRSISTCTHIVLDSLAQADTTLVKPETNKSSSSFVTDEIEGKESAEIDKYTSLCSTKSTHITTIFSSSSGSTSRNISSSSKNSAFNTVYDARCDALSRSFDPEYLLSTSHSSSPSSSSRVLLISPLFRDLRAFDNLSKVSLLLPSLAQPSTAGAISKKEKDILNKIGHNKDVCSSVREDKSEEFGSNRPENDSNNVSNCAGFPLEGKELAERSPQKIGKDHRLRDVRINTSLTITHQSSDSVHYSADQHHQLKPQQQQQQQQPQNKYLTQRIANKATPKYLLEREDGSSVEAESPLQLLRECMEGRIRTRITTRRKNGIRGFVDAYVKAFDAHWNMVLYDADEQYILNKHALRRTRLGCFLSEKGIIKRHLSKVLLRGDNVVMVSKLPGIKHAV